MQLAYVLDHYSRHCHVLNTDLADILLHGQER